MTWAERILEAEEREKRGEPPFTDEDRYLAHSFRSCAVSELDARVLPKTINQIDPILGSLGCEFATALGCFWGHEERKTGGNVEKAKRVYRAIHARELEILRGEIHG